MEWHLNAITPSQRLSALALRLSINQTLHEGCSEPPIVTHEEGLNNNREPVPGLAEELAKHNGSDPLSRFITATSDRWQRAHAPNTV